MLGKQALVVGGTSGIGRGMAEYLAKQGASVTIAGRNAKEGEIICSKLKELSPDGALSVHTFEAVDGFDMQSVSNLAKKFPVGRDLDYLVLTQGMATIQGYTPTKDGLDQKLALHFYSRLVLMQLLAPTLAQSKDGGKVMSVLSAGVHGNFAGYESDPTLANTYSIKNAADAAGLYNDIAMDKLSTRFPTVNFTHAAPGFVSTNWGTEMPWAIRMLVRGLQVFGKSPQTCAQTLGDSWKMLPAGFHLINESGGRASATSIHEQVKASSFWESTQTLLQKWLQ